MATRKRKDGSCVTAECPNTGRATHGHQGRCETCYNLEKYLKCSCPGGGKGFCPDDGCPNPARDPSGRCVSCGTGATCGRQQRPNGWQLLYIKNRMAEATDDCQDWPEDNRNQKGYGYLVKYDEKQLRPHQVVCILAHGDMRAEGMVVRHLCGNPWCVNKRHLTWGTQTENNLDAGVHSLLGGGADVAQLIKDIAKAGNQTKKLQYVADFLVRK
ncbi:MAG: HNH endonuclease, partial [Ilumatobacter sp.]|nr:HNH endonuclease [Ilumatobacter sp.]